MKIRRTISIDKGDLDTLKPFLDINGGNLSLALRHMIGEYKERSKIADISADKQKTMMLRNQTIENRIAALIPIPLVKWMIKRNPGVPPLGTFRVIMEKYAKLLGLSSLTINDYMKLVNAHGDIFGYQIRQEIDLSPDCKRMRITFESDDSENLKGAVPHYSCLLAHNPLLLKTLKVVESPNLIIVDYEQCNDEKEAHRSVIGNFGGSYVLFDEIQNSIEYWKNAISIVKADNYENLIISRSILLQLINSCEFSEQLNHLVSSIYGKHIEESDYRDIIRHIGTIFQTNGLIHRVEQQNDEILIYHVFDDRRIIDVLNETILKTLGASGQKFNLKKGEKLTIFTMFNSTFPKNLN